MENQKELVYILAGGCLAMLFILMTIFSFLMVHRKKMLEKETKIAAIEQEKKIAIFKASTEAEEKQKVKIARDLHDGVVATLSAVIRSVDKNIKDYENNKFSIERLSADLQTIEHTNNILRNISHDLIPPNVLPYGLIKALGYRMSALHDLVGSKADFEDRTQFEENLPLSKSDELKVFWICQEIINNLLKHGKYKYLKVVAENDKDRLTIDFMHDGIGITNKEVLLLRETGTGLGLNSIFSRAMMLDAVLNYSTEQGSSCVSVSIPFKT